MDAGTDGVLLVLRGVGKSFGRHPALAPTDLTVSRGEVVAVVGANGSGKTTLLRLCAGLLRPDTGSVSRTGHVGYVPQDGGLAGLLTADEHFALVGEGRRLDTKQARAEGHTITGRLGWPASKATAGTLSGGTRQKLNLAVGDLGDPDLLLLDEPYQGFDAPSYAEFWDLVADWRQASRGVVLVTHLLHDLDKVDRVVELHVADNGDRS